MSERTEITAFTGLRGLMAWWVALYHVSEVVSIWGMAKGLIRHGMFAVDLFFIMSGFVISLSYAKAFQDRIRLRAYIPFMIKRLARIYPLHLFILLIYVSIPAVMIATNRSIADDRFPIYYFVQSLFLVQNWGFASGLGWNPVAWSISSEAVFYILFPVAAYAMARRRHRISHVAATLAACFACMIVLGWQNRSLEYDITHFGTLRCLMECAIGMCIFHLVSLKPIDRSASYRLTILAIGLALLYALALVPDYVAIPAAFACLLTALTQPRSAPARLLSHPIIIYLGEISFSTYLVHYFVKDVLKLSIVGRMPEPAVFGIYIATVLLASIALHRWIEVPGRDAGRRLAARVQNRSTVQAA